MFIALIVEDEFDCSAMCPAPKESRDARLRFRVKEDGNDAWITLVVVDVVVEKAALPIDAFAFLRRHITLDATLELGCADAKDEIRVLAANLLIAPARPVYDFLVVELVEFNIDAVAT